MRAFTLALATERNNKATIKQQQQPTYRRIQQKIHFIVDGALSSHKATVHTYVCMYDRIKHGSTYEDNGSKCSHTQCWQGSGSSKNRNCISVRANVTAALRHSRTPTKQTANTITRTDIRMAEIICLVPPLINEITGRKQTMQICSTHIHTYTNIHTYIHAFFVRCCSCLLCSLSFLVYSKKF